MSAQYDASVALDRKLTEDETRELKISLMPYFHATGDNEASPEDINDLLDYAFAMVNNQKTVEYVIQELVGMEMEFCNAAVAEKVGAELSGFLKKAKGEVETSEGSKIASLKSTSSEKGNALTMSGALGASREGGRNNNNKPKAEKGGKVDNKKRDDRRGGDRKGRGDRNDRGGRGRGRSTHKEAFDRLSNGGRRGRDNDRRRRDEDRRGGRGGRGDGGRGGGRGRGDRGNRRSRDEYEDDKRGEDNNDFVPVRDGGRGRGRGRGGEGRGAKRARYDDHYDEGYGNGGYYDEGYGYDDGYGYGGYHGYGGRGRGFRGGRGRGRFGGRGRGRGRGRGGPPPAEGGEGAEGGKEETPNASDAANHPSPMVQATYSGGRYGGRGRFGRGRGRGGRGRGGGRAHVVNMIQSKTWVRKKPEDAAADAAPPAE